MSLFDVPAELAAVTVAGRGAMLSRLKHRIAEANAEIARLREVAGLDSKSTLQTWGAHAPQDWRDKMAADALIAEKLDERRALLRLGFKFDSPDGWTLPPEFHAACEAVFGTPGVKAILERNLEDANSNKQKILARLVQTAMHGTDGESTRAAQQIARIADWNEGDKSAAPRSVTNILQLLGAPTAGPEAARVKQIEADPDGVIDAEHFLVHQPGAAAAVIDEPRALHP